MSLFNSDTPVDPEVNEAAAPAPTELDQLLEGIKNEQGERKYANPLEAIKALQHSQDFIATLKREKQELEEKFRMEQEKASLFAKPADKTTEAAPVAAPAGLTPEQVLELVEQREKQKVASANRDSVAESLKASFGESYEATLVAKISELGLSTELVDSMAQTSPKALLKLLGVEQKGVKPSVSSSVTSSALKGKPEEPRKFNPFSGEQDARLTKWRESVERTNARLGLK